MRSLLWRAAREQRGSQGLEAAAAALAAAIIIAALLGGLDIAGPAVRRAFDCAAAVLGGGGGGCAGTNAPPAASETPGGEDRSWWERAWDWTKDNVLDPVGNFFESAWDWAKGTWDWLWQEHEWTWWKNALEWLQEKGPLGTVAAGILGFAMDLLFGVGADGKFRWGMVIFATVTSILSIFGVGLLAKIPVVGRLFAGGGTLARLGGWLAGLPVVRRLLQTWLGQWLTKLGTEGFADLLQGKFGTWLTKVGSALRRIPVLGPILLAIRESKLVRTIGNYAWTLLVKGWVGIPGDVIKTLVKDILNPRPGTSMEWVVTRMKRLFVWKAVRDILKWLLRPVIPFFPS